MSAKNCIFALLKAKTMAKHFMMSFLLLLTGQVACPQNANSQDVRPWEALFADITTLDDMESSEWEETYEMLCELEQAPLDINTATREQLQQLPFLSDRQVEDIQEYIYRYGAMKSTAELAMIASIDYATRQLLTHFVDCPEHPASNTLDWKKALGKAQHAITITANVPFYKRRGDKEGYLGYPYRHSLRYQLHYRDQLKAGLVGAQDAGEPFFAHRNKAGYDFYSFYVEAHRMGRISTLVAGRYKASFGMGLVMGGTFGLGKMTTLTALGRRGSGLKAHSSRQAARFLQGAAATMHMAKGLEATAFASYRKVDATLADGDSAIANIVADGYHRTATEMDKKGNASETVGGTHLNYRHGALQIGATATITHYSKPLHPNTAQRYRTYYPAGNDFWNVGIDYAYTHWLFTLHGETATGKGGAIATINSIGFSPTSRLSLLLLQRFYGKKYHTMHGSSFSEGGRVQNESGVYAGMAWQPLRYLRLTAYTDFAQFPFATYQAQVASRAWDNLVQAQLSWQHLALTARYRLKWREHDNAEHTALTATTTHRARLSATLTQGDWRLAANADWVSAEAAERSRGWMASGNVGYSHAWLKVTASMGYFCTDDSESRIYGYEPGVLYDFGYRQYEGEGIRWAVVARADFGRRLMVAAHLATTNYFDRDHISTGYQRIDRSAKTDLQLQVRWRL